MKPLVDLPNRLKPIEIEVNDRGCHLVTSHSKSKDGHVKIRVNNKRFLLHRIAYEQNIGKIPDGLVVRHKCDNANCINPKHLELGTHADNVNDRVKRNRSAKGSKNGRSKLTEDNVKYIKSNLELKNSHLAKLFNVDRKVIYDIRNGNTWKHIS
ncbi:HNH endonuclease signature motif containing protein [Halobacillus rhizosphaerae]|uniref:HNH endonuclease signature motif containing protein n=1 Tax=Halobacillus rhizosphaerae TaxID=3064889 RepID=UPI00398A5A71